MPRPRNYRSDDSMHPGSWIGGALALIALIAYPLISFVTSQMNNYSETITITRLDDQATGNNGHQYLIFTPQGVFKDTDNFWRGKFNSSDLFNELQVGATYRCQVHGERQHLSSNYPDLMTCVKIPHPEGVGS
jgi:hypothetical protein